MGSTLNMTAILVADAMGILLLSSVAVGNFYTIKEQAKRNKYLAILFVATALSCLMDGISTIADGNSRIAVLLGNTLLYICGPITAVAWIMLVADYIKIRISKLHKILIGTFFSLTNILIIANLFTPILFTVNEYNVYERSSGLYVIYATSYFGLLIDAVVMYLIKKHDSGGLKFFPMWAYVVPITIGMVIQNLFYGVSTISPFMTISIVTMTITFQNHLVFRDQLTDLYNRYYLSVLEKKISQKSSKEYSVIMLDINDFKGINDIHGHDAGDEALIHLSRTLISVVDKSGEVVRYAGDEFIVILNSHEDAAVEELIRRIRRSLKELCSAAALPYELAVAVGWCKFRSGEKTLNEYITEADSHMYKNKQDYYKRHPKLHSDSK